MTVNVRVELKPGIRPDDRAFRMMFQDFKKRVSEAGVMSICKTHQFFESESSKARKKKQDCINKMEQETIEQKLNAGEKMKCSSKMIKKIRAKQTKAAKAAKREFREDRRTH